MKIVNKLYKDWAPAMRKRLRNLSLRREGDICKVLIRRSCDTFVAFEGDMIVGWGVYIVDFWHSDCDFMLYVRKRYRRKGIGRALLNAAIKKYGRVGLHAWDYKSGAFFAKMLDETEFAQMSRGSDWLK